MLDGTARNKRDARARNLGRSAGALTASPNAVYTPILGGHTNEVGLVVSGRE
jgi:hypothetical protein